MVPSLSRTAGPKSSCLGLPRSVGLSPWVGWEIRDIEFARTIGELANSARFFPTPVDGGGFPHPGTDGRESGAIDLHRYGSLQQNNGNHQVICIPSAQQNTFHVPQRSVIDADAFPFPEKRPGPNYGAKLNHCLRARNLLCFDRNRTLSNPYEVQYAGGRQHGHTHGRIDLAEHITVEKRTCTSLVRSANDGTSRTTVGMYGCSSILWIERPATRSAAELGWRSMGVQRPLWVCFRRQKSKSNPPMCLVISVCGAHETLADYDYFSIVNTCRYGLTLQYSKCRY